jgi:hypothetical protein
VGLLFVVKNKAVDVPLNIINLVYFQLISLTCRLKSPMLSSRVPVSP